MVAAKQEATETQAPQVLLGEAANEAAVAEQEDAQPVVIYRYLDADSGKEIPAETVDWDEPELSDGAVVHVLKAEGGKQHYTVKSMVGEDVVTVYLDKARNILWRMVFLGVLLTASWFVLDFIFGKIF
ncbi:hypothetical protein N1030_02675 [Desulfovibrio mangrovi]|uniref:hypothetical protein n=1 Tax=Desulfovibrio mangrovi TaxID=2976983 RepID=UPI0022475295|nr:hypothetical protein [Desulfovibrio mangrovi]UZP67899.1 hypothetical protein N1030_02675 [Desulfovibrio mangrovi]